MSEPVQVDHLAGAQSTALMVLEPKAHYADMVPESEWFIDFSKARDICRRLSDAEARKAVGSNSWKVRAAAIGLAVRARSIEDLLEKCLARVEDPVVVHLGCGLSDRSARYGSRIEAGLVFYDIDFAEMIEVRREFYEASANYRMVAADLSKSDWVEQIDPVHRGRSFIFVGEGFTPYLTKAQMKDLFALLEREFRGCQFVFDTYSALKVREAQATVGRFGAQLHFSNDDPAEIAAWSPNGTYAFVEEDNLFLRDEFLNSEYLPRPYRAIMRGLVKLFGWHTGTIRSTVAMVFRIGRSPGDDAEAGR